MDYWGDVINGTENIGKDVEIVFQEKKSSIWDIAGKGDRTPKGVDINYQEAPKTHSSWE